MTAASIISQHGYLIVGMVLFCSAAGLPLPISITLLIAGAAAATHVLSVAEVLAVAVAAGFAGDTVMYLGGRYTGWWLLAAICRMSGNLETCVYRSADYFYRRGARTLLFAKFVPGLGVMAAPLAGSLNMRFSRFARLDLVNVTTYCTLWVVVGYALHRSIDRVVVAVVTAGHVLLAIVLVLVTVYAGWVAVATLYARRYSKIERVPVAEVARLLEERDPERLVIIADVRSHGYYDPGMQRIRNSIRLEPNRLMYEFVALREFMQPECEIFVYCSCARETTSARVAHMLMKQNCTVKIIDGGLKAWAKGGFPLEPVPASEVEHLPRFE